MYKLFILVTLLSVNSHADINSFLAPYNLKADGTINDYGKYLVELNSANGAFDYYTVSDKPNENGGNTQVVRSTNETKTVKSVSGNYQKLNRVFVAIQETPGELQVLSYVQQGDKRNTMAVQCVTEDSNLRNVILSCIPISPLYCERTLKHPQLIRVNEGPAFFELEDMEYIEAFRRLMMTRMDRGQFEKDLEERSMQFTKSLVSEFLVPEEIRVPFANLPVIKNFGSKNFIFNHFQLELKSNTALLIRDSDSKEVKSEKKYLLNKRIRRVFSLCDQTFGSKSL